MKRRTLQRPAIEIHPDAETQEQSTSLEAEWRVIFREDLIQRLNLKPLQYLACLLTCPGAMADLIFRLQGQFGHGLAFCGKKKDGVVTKTVSSLSLKGNNAATLTTACVTLTIRSSYGN